jgi:uncharacterized DUF497 family protein
MLEFDWDEANISHIARHGVTPQEAEQVIRNLPLDLGSRIHGDEHRMAQLGATHQGRILFVVTTWRSHKIRVVTSYPAGRRAQQVYSKRTGGSDDAPIRNT